LPFGKEVEAGGKKQASDAERRGDTGGVHACQYVGKPQNANCAYEKKKRSDRGKQDYD